MVIEQPTPPVVRRAWAPIEVPRRNHKKSFRRHGMDLWQNLAAAVLVAPLCVMPLDMASGFGGWICRTLGPLNRRHNVARENLRRAMPELSDAKVESIIAEMWDNLGRTITELFHLGAFLRSMRTNGDLIEFRGVERLEKMRKEGSGAIFIGAHLANWELGPLVLSLAGLEAAQMYRRLNNTYIDRVCLKQRVKLGPNLIPKGPDGVKRMLAMVRKGGSVLMAVDQKFNEGLPVPFFGRDAMTTTGYAKMAQRYHVPIIPIRIERLVGARFRVTVCPPIQMPEPDDTTDGALHIMTSVNQVLESWIRERPGQWQWGHRRWPD